MHWPAGFAEEHLPSLGGPRYSDPEVAGERSRLAERLAVWERRLALTG
jgi:hypothetical protein